MHFGQSKPENCDAKCTHVTYGKDELDEIL